METETIKELEAVTAGELNFYIGEEARSLFTNESFLKEWDVLYDTCSWATVFQNRSFVITWYETYRSKFLPIIISAYYRGQLTGLLTLTKAINESAKEIIMGAGEYEAEYQTWITAKQNDEEFIKEALLKVQQHFPHTIIHLRFIPPQAPLKWVNENYWKSKCVLQPHARPLMDLRHPGIAKMTSKTEFRNKHNRLKRLGNLTFERITKKEEFIKILDELIIQYDFRQGAKFNCNQFKDEPLKVEFLHALFEKNLLYVSVLKVNGQVYASIVAIEMRDWVHLGGINIHNPFNAKFYSPGYVNFILLGQQLAKEGCAMFDLTPGGDPYKERIANKHDVVHELVITNSFVNRIKRKLRKQYYHRLIKMGKWPMGVEVSIQRKMYQLKAGVRKIKNNGFSIAVEKVKDLIKRPEEKVYVATPERFTNLPTLPINKNSLQDLLQYEASEAGPTRWGFLSDAMRRLERGQSAYTYCQSGRLLATAWLEEGSRLHCFYIHPQGRTQLDEIVKAIIAKAIQDSGQVQVVIKEKIQMLQGPKMI